MVVNRLWVRSPVTVYHYLYQGEGDRFLHPKINLHFAEEVRDWVAEMISGELEVEQFFDGPPPRWDHIAVLRFEHQSEMILFKVQWGGNGVY